MITSNSTGVTTFTTPSDREIAMSRVFDAPKRLLWAALTDPRHLPKWMLGPAGWTMPVCEVDLRPGGAWHFVWRRADGTEMGMTGVYREVNPYDRLVNTEAWGGDWAETLNTTELFEADGRTTVVTTMLFPSHEARDRAMGTGMNDGVERSYALLDEYLRTMG
jgi:uncharacterized protein YndB with AHSA1/START domain